MILNSDLTSRVNHSATRPLYSHVTKDRYLYFDPAENRWEIGTDATSPTSEVHTATGEILELRDIDQHCVVSRLPGHL